MRPEYRIALLARRYHLLATRPALCKLVRDEADRAYVLDELHGALLDAVQVLGAGEVDLTCAEAVRQLSKKGARAKRILQSMSWMGNERLIAMTYALPPERRHVVYNNGDWAMAMFYSPPGVEEAVERVPELNELFGGVTEVRAALMQVAHA